MSRVGESGQKHPDQKQPNQEQPYHHGSLRETLLEVGEALIEEKGVEAFTLRGCARRAGVSHGAPAHHFGDVTGFLTELAATGFEELDALMTRYRKDSGADPYAQFVATGVAYVEYALRRPARFRLMFRSELLRPDHPRLCEAGDRTFGQLMETLAGLPGSATPAADGAAVELGIDERASLAWAIVHGLASLTLDNPGYNEILGGRDNAPTALRRMLAATREAFSPS